MSVEEKQMTDILDRLEEKLDTAPLKSLNKDVEDVMFTIRDKSDKLLKYMRKKGEYTPAIKKINSSLKKVQAELADLSSNIRSRL